MNALEQKRVLQAISRAIQLIEQEKTSYDEVEKRYMISVQEEMKLAFTHALKTNIFYS